MKGKRYSRGFRLFAFSSDRPNFGTPNRKNYHTRPTKHPNNPFYLKNWYKLCPLWKGECSSDSISETQPHCGGWKRGGICSVPEDVPDPRAAAPPARGAGRAVLQAAEAAGGGQGLSFPYPRFCPMASKNPVSSFPPGGAVPGADLRESMSFELGEVVPPQFIHPVVALLPMETGSPPPTLLLLLSMTVLTSADPLRGSFERPWMRSSPASPPGPSRRS